ncbi:hypothetical protein SAMN02745132_04186 [Enterovibrio nigricans DSM 22720]|uniref:Uncharacterized protein n=1 Tax=Enterovibrio nigricans DSM 22720 TaxID=1121868 RepID=A0A1T4VQ74_9GAMM|nr:hypothetical protein SAMN02745132_04186 [Enterovibrio nigricans DSM 22720]
MFVLYEIVVFGMKSWKSLSLNVIERFCDKFIDTEIDDGYISYWFYLRVSVL